MKKLIQKKYKDFKNFLNMMCIEKTKKCLCINKNRSKKINIVFVCHRPAVWTYLKSIYESCIQDDKFNVTIVAIPNKKQLSDKGLCHEVYESEGAEEYFKDFPCRVINGYNYETKEWFDIKALEPNYVFFQTPYNICRPSVYNIKNVFQYAKVCYVHYGLSMLKEQCVFKEFAQDFMQYLYFIFAETRYHQQSYKDEICVYNKLFDFNKIHLTGCCAFDNINQYFNAESKLWKHSNHSNYRIIWTPRWCKNENNCNFEEYNNILFDYAEFNKCDFVFRPHPQAFHSYKAEGILTEKDIEELVLKYKNSKYCTLDTTKNYLETLYSSDVLVSDPSGICFEYLLTGKPIIYTKKSDDWANEFAKRVLIEASYNVENQQQLQQTLEMLKSGSDPLKEKRMEIIKEAFYIPQQGAGYTIKELIKKDFYGKN